VHAHGTYWASTSRLGWFAFVGIALTFVARVIFKAWGLLEEVIAAMAGADRSLKAVISHAISYQGSCWAIPPMRG
jgi:hypothetical protein